MVPRWCMVGDSVRPSFNRTIVHRSTTASNEKRVRRQRPPPFPTSGPRGRLQSIRAQRKARNCRRTHSEDRRNRVEPAAVSCRPRELAENVQEARHNRTAKGRSGISSTISVDDRQRTKRTPPTQIEGRHQDVSRQEKTAARQRSRAKQATEQPAGQSRPTIRYSHDWRQIASNGMLNGGSKRLPGSLGGQPHHRAASGRIPGRL